MCWGRIVALVLALAAAGCPGPAASPSRARCPAELRVLAGACVAPAVADAACGPRAASSAEGCERRAPCDAGRARDLARGQCLALRETRLLAIGAGILLQNGDEVLVCPDAGELVTGVADGAARLGCLPPPAASPESCPPGSVRNGAACRPVVDHAGKVDVPAWVHDVLGADGGAGAAPLCRGLQESVLALAAPGSTEVTVEVALTFPDNDVSQVTFEARGPGELEHAVAPLVEALRALGGESSVAGATARVRCRVRSDRPAAQIP
ncbi:MAG: hypothetical protein JWP97_1074 [Labilithrix sp.]|nr:hypothetical protein [Labilithrix sp.]